MATVFTTQDSKVLMPREIADGMIVKARSLSTIAQLSAREPMRFGEVDYITFNDFPKAEFVEEGSDKGNTSGGFTSVTAKPHKAQVTMRFSEEVQWASEDYQLDVINQLAAAGQVSLSRALDLGMYHRINPLTGSVITGWDNYITATTKKVEIATADADADVRSAVRPGRRVLYRRRPPGQRRRCRPGDGRGLRPEVLLGPVSAEAQGRLRRDQRPALPAVGVRHERHGLPRYPGRPGQHRLRSA